MTMKLPDTQAMGLWTSPAGEVCRPYFFTKVIYGVEKVTDATKNKKEKEILMNRIYKKTIVFPDFLDEDTKDRIVCDLKQKYEATDGKLGRYKWTIEYHHNQLDITFPEAEPDEYVKCPPVDDAVTPAVEGSIRDVIQGDFVLQRVNCITKGDCK